MVAASRMAPATAFKLPQSYRMQKATLSMTGKQKERGSDGCDETDLHPCELKGRNSWVVDVNVGYVCHFRCKRNMRCETRRDVLKGSKQGVRERSKRGVRKLCKRC